MEIDQKKLENNIWKFYLYEILYSMMFYTPIIVLFYQNNGLKLTQIMILQSISSVVWIFAEIPTGHFADVIGRKKSLLMTGIFATLAMTLYAFGNNFYYFLFAVLSWALAGAFISGADSAFMYDNLKALGREHSYKKIWGNAIFFYSAGVAVASIVGGLLGGLNLRYPFFAMIPFYLLLVLVSLSFYEPKLNRNLTPKNSIFNSMGLIKEAIFHNKEIRWLICYSAVITSATGVAYWLYQPYFELSGLKIVYFGLVFAAFNLISAVSAKYSHVIEEKLGRKASLVSLFVLTSLCYLLMGKIVFIFGFVIAFIMQFVDGFSSVVISDYIHKETDSSVRATTFSVKGFIEHIFYALMAPLVGWVVDVYTLPQALIVMGVIVGVVGFIFIGVRTFSSKNELINGV
ncbi:MAG: MFS transporter [bacterium]|nr:MFS transporter [bacterium]